MALVKAYDDVENPRIQRNLPNGHFAWRTDFIARPEDKSIDTPMAFLAEGSPSRVLRAHFHQVDQFQVIYNGSGAMGKHPVGPGAVHFSRAYTPYGPISYSDDKGLGFLTLRAHRDPGAQYLPESREVLDKVANRTPWQITAIPDFDIDPGERGVAMKALEGLQGNDGLAGFSVKMSADAKTYAPDPSKGDGQYILVMKGGIRHEGKLRKDLTIIWVGKNDGPFELVAGSEGLEAIILTFPVPGGGIPDDAKVTASSSDGELKTWQCVLCAFVYDEAAGFPEEGIAPGTRWEDVPESFGCPDCSAKKADFEMIEF